MPPPPLSDAAVLELLRSSTDDKEKALGLEPYRDDSPDQAASDEVWLTYYRQEWERVYRFGLAEDAMASILAKLEAPENPDQAMRGMLTRANEQHVVRPLREMCGSKPVQYAYDATGKPGWHFYVFWVLFLSIGIYSLYFTRRMFEVVPCLLVLILLGFYMLHRMKKPDKNWMDWRVTPWITYGNLAKQVQRQVQQQGELMLDVVGRLRQVNLQK